MTQDIKTMGAGKKEKSPQGNCETRCKNTRPDPGKGWGGNRMLQDLCIGKHRGVNPRPNRQGQKQANQVHGLTSTLSLGHSLPLWPTLHPLPNKPVPPCVDGR